MLCYVMLLCYVI